MTAPSSEQLREVWAVERHDHHSHWIDWQVCPACALRFALALLADAERELTRINELEQDNVAFEDDARVADLHISEVLTERDELRARLAAAERVIEWAASEHYAATGVKDPACKRCQTLAVYDALITKETTP